MFFSNKELHSIADWCFQREIISDRIDRAIVISACHDLGIKNDGKFDLYQLKEIGSLYYFEKNNQGEGLE